VEGQPLLLPLGFRSVNVTSGLNILALGGVSPDKQNRLFGFQEELGRLPIKVGETDKFHNIESAIPRFGLRHKRVGHAQALAHISLCQACLFPGRDQPGQKGIVTGLERRGMGFARFPSFALCWPAHHSSVGKPCDVP
jgi:hypothetical protein